MEKNNISVERMIELEIWLVDNYPLVINPNVDVYDLFLSNFSYDEANYLYYAYHIPYYELVDDINDDLKLYDALMKKYSVGFDCLISRIKNARAIKKYLSQNPNSLKQKNIQDYNKLVRDNIPNIIDNNDGVPVFRILTDKDYWNALLKKVDEEKLEVSNALTKEERKKELADLLELIKAMAEFNGFTLSEIEEEANIKRNKSGGFTRKIYLEKVIEKK